MALRENRTLPDLRAVEITRISKGIIPNEKVALPWKNSVECCTEMGQEEHHMQQWSWTASMGGTGDTARMVGQRRGLGTSKTGRTGHSGWSWRWCGCDGAVHRAPHEASITCRRSHLSGEPNKGT